MIKKTYFTVVTTNKKIILNILEYFKNNIVGIKSLEFKIWAASLNKKFKTQKENFDYLIKIRDIIRRIRSIRLDKNFKQKK